MNNINELISSINSSINEVYKEEINSRTIYEEKIYMWEFKKIKDEIKKVLDKHRKEKTKSNKQEEPKAIERVKLSDEEIKELKNQINEMIKDLKSEYNKMKNTKDFKDKCIKSSKEYNQRPGEGQLKIGYIPKVNIKIFENIDPIYHDAIIEVIDDTQDVRIHYRWILYDLADTIEGKYDFSIDFGDGDEGCLYLYY